MLLPHVSRRCNHTHHLFANIHLTSPFFLLQEKPNCVFFVNTHTNLLQSHVKTAVFLQSVSMSWFLQTHIIIIIIIAITYNQYLLQSCTPKVANTLIKHFLQSHSISVFNNSTRNRIKYGRHSWGRHG
jgi:hypothetical protein